MSLDDLEKQLYQARKNAGKDTVKKEEKEFQESSAPKSIPEWEEDEDVLKDKSRGKIKQFAKWIFAIAIAAVIVGGGVFFALRYGANSKGVVVDIQGPNKVGRGVPFEVSVQISNDIDTFIKEGSLSVTMTQGLLGADVAAKKGLITEPVGDLGGGSLTRKVIKLFATGETNSIQKVTVRFSFTSGRASYEIEESKEITIGDSAISLEIKKPAQVMSGSKFDIQVNYKNTSNVNFSDVALEVKYPPEYHFAEASYNPASLNNFWRLGEVKAGSEGSIQITGDIDASDKNSFDFNSSAFVTFGSQDYKVTEKAVNIFIAPSPIVIGMKVNNSDVATARPGERLSYSIRYENKSGISLADTVIEAKLDGSMFDFGSIRTDGTLDSRTDTITWNASRVASLGLLAPGATGEVTFSIALLPTLPVKRASDKNFSAKVNVRMDSPSVPYYISDDKTTGFGSMETKISGSVLFDVQAFYRDSLAQIINAGTLPPKVNKATQYTVHWIFKNYGSDLRDVVVKGSLEGGVRWTGVVKSNISSVPEYNPRTQEIVWNIEKIQANRGLFGDVVEAIFQIEAVPSVTDVGSYKKLIGTTTYLGTDDFTNTRFSGRAEGITTGLPDDKTLGRNDGIVVQ